MAVNNSRLIYFTVNIHIWINGPNLITKKFIAHTFVYFLVLKCIPWYVKSDISAMIELDGPHGSFEVASRTLISTSV